ncbi:oxidoreductase [Psychroserpens sp.]|uniref:oxidoreductase n=1 Tax=Psychroserpens sp. TaxID=2020870 RepID=UPI001B02EA4F|nr:oxidoreductase [Psychroserpens sp.]MBO6607043.1 oxidoreductase [Psychroserpens sp.]MBO6632149.1 oxidoreductase [Psychroserpens sp.]MBO6654189.1 oxidoreductase [Psychroserpens sp.]MBO6682525.1 oxidoreductase [Psychroserpens sp.]MBO6750815.1 oxidoreductase [Psychroserpens sp.]
MKHLYWFLCCLVLYYACGSRPENPGPRVVNSLEIEHLMEDSLLNVRALEVDKGGTGVFATSRGQIGFIYVSKYLDLDYNNKETLECDILHELNFNKDSIPNFRVVAKTTKRVFALSIGNPAVIFSPSEDQLDYWPIVYQEHHEKVFYDSMAFWNDMEGIAIGDPTETCMSIIITRDGGNSWKKIPCDQLPAAVEGEAAFAASDSNIAIVDDHTWVATGGKASRILYSSDKGETWEVFDTPIIQGQATNGMYSIDFYDKDNGFAIGGDYTKAADSSANKIRTKDGGKTWEIVAENKSPGYRSCVQYVPNGNAQELVAVGFKGVDYSNDAGNTWKHLSDEGYYTIRFVDDSTAYAAGRGRISKLTFRN